MGNVRMRAEQINYGATNVKAAMDDLDPAALIELNNRMNRVDAWKATVKTEEKTGAEVTFTNALALAAVSLSAEIEAVQDLHGYDKPWVGGAYKNKLPLTVDAVKETPQDSTWSGNDITIKGIKYTLVTDDAGNLTKIHVKKESTFTGISFLNLAMGIALPAGDYKVNGGVSADLYIRIGEDSTPSGSGTAIGSNTGGDTAVPVASGKYYSFSLGISNNFTGETDIYPMVRPSTELDATFAPYSNICPISGRTAVEIADEKENLLSLGTKVDGYTNSGTMKFFATPHARGYQFNTADLPDTITFTASNGNRANVSYANTPFAHNSTVAVFDSSNSLPRTITVNKSYQYIHIQLIYDESTPTLSGVKFEEGTSIPAVKVVIQLGQTVYGGTLNVTTGVATVTHANIASYNGEAIGEPWISSLDEYTQGGTPTTGAQVVYTLAAPTTIQLTPSQLTMLKGYNRLSSDGGGDITVEAYTGAAWGGDEA